jgi:hypothetical protein
MVTSWPLRPIADIMWTAEISEPPKPEVAIWLPRKGLSAISAIFIISSYRNYEVVACSATSIEENSLDSGLEYL